MKKQSWLIINTMAYKLRKAPKRDLYWIVAIDGTHKSRDPLPLEHAKAQMRALYAAERRKLGGVRKSIVKNGVYTFNPMLDAREEEDIPAQRHALQLQRVNDALEIERAALARELAADQEAARIRGEESAAQYRRAQQQRAAPASAPASSRRRQVPIVYPSTRDCLTTTGECIGVMSALAGRGSKRYKKIGGLDKLGKRERDHLISHGMSMGFTREHVIEVMNMFLSEGLFGNELIDAVLEYLADEL